MLDWRSLYYGHVESQEVAKAVKDYEWQALRRAMKGKSLETKYAMLKGYRATMISRLEAGRIDEDGRGTNHKLRHCTKPRWPDQTGGLQMNFITITADGKYRVYQGDSGTMYFEEVAPSED